MGEVVRFSDYLGGRKVQIVSSEEDLETTVAAILDAVYFFYSDSRDDIPGDNAGWDEDDDTIVTEIMSEFPEIDYLEVTTDGSSASIYVTLHDASIYISVDMEWKQTRLNDSGERLLE